MTQESIRPVVNLWQTVFKVEDFKVKEYEILGIYTLVKVKQDQDNYFLDTDSQLVAVVRKGHHKINSNPKTFNGPIEKSMFYRLDEFYLTQEEAEATLKKKRKDKKDSLRRQLNQKIEELKEEIRLKKEALKNIKP